MAFSITARFGTSIWGVILPLVSADCNRVTIPAAGSEMSESSVITNEDGDIKVGYSNDISRPKFAIMNPERTFTLPDFQTSAGVTDMIMHIMERYFHMMTT